MHSIIRLLIHSVKPCSARLAWEASALPGATQLASRFCPSEPSQTSRDAPAAVPTAFEGVPQAFGGLQLIIDLPVPLTPFFWEEAILDGTAIGIS